MSAKPGSRALNGRLIDVLCCDTLPSGRRPEQVNPLAPNNNNNNNNNNNSNNSGGVEGQRKFISLLRGLELVVRGRSVTR